MSTVICAVSMSCFGCGHNPVQPGTKALPYGDYAELRCGDITPQFLTGDPSEPQVGGGGRKHERCIKAAEYYLREETRREGIRYASELKGCDDQPYQPVSECQERVRQDHEQRLFWINCAYVQMIKDCK